MSEDTTTAQKEHTAPVSARDLIAAGKLVAVRRMLDETTKRELAETGNTFTVTNIAFADDGEFGLYWQIDAENESGPFTFRLGAHEGRDAFINALGALVVDRPVSDLCLRLKPTKRGHPFIYLDVADPE